MVYISKKYVFMNFLHSKTFPVSAITDGLKQRMFEIYSFYYGGTSPDLFFRDLNQKDQVVLLFDDQGQIRGFSTLRVLEIQNIRTIFSGDTIVENEFWGRNDLAEAWIETAGIIKREAPHIPLYWFLIVKGHRTYRFLNVFSKKYYPAFGWETPPQMREMMNTLAHSYFGESYDPSKGIVRYQESKGHLLEPWAKISEKDLRRPEVQFFLKINPNYFKGEELVCLCELDKDNLKPIAQRYFERGN